MLTMISKFERNKIIIVKNIYKSNKMLL